MNFRKNQSVIYMDRKTPRFAKVVQVVHPTHRNDPGSYVVQFNDNTGARRTRNTVREKLISDGRNMVLVKRHINNLEKKTNALRANFTTMTTQLNRAINELKKHAQNNRRHVRR